MFLFYGNKIEDVFDKKVEVVFEKKMDLLLGVISVLFNFGKKVDSFVLGLLSFVFLIGFLFFFGIFSLFGKDII